MPNLFQETGKTDHILTIGTGGKVYYVYLYSRVGSTTYGCYGFPEILPAIPRTAQKQLKKDLCFCTDRHSSANWYQNYYVFCKDGTTCNHLVHRNCLRDYHTKKEREYNTVFNLNFVCDGCRKQQENEEF
ncbi:hypothetical protein EON65_26065 [archaeon]|nr:MAG: hypothetical protein EON65_26065 [archaeon]